MEFILGVVRRREGGLPTISGVRRCSVGNRVRKRAFSILKKKHCMTGKCDRRAACGWN